MKAGFVFLEKGFRPFTSFREIRRGRNRERIEVQIRYLKGDGEIVERPHIVDRDSIKRYPK